MIKQQTKKRNILYIVLGVLVLLAILTYFFWDKVKGYFVKAKETIKNTVSNVSNASSTNTSTASDETDKFLRDFEVRQADIHGSGVYNAPRGSRLHNGIDLIALPQRVFKLPVNVQITKYGYPYSDDLTYRYVEFKIMEGKHQGLICRAMYVSTKFSVGQTIDKNIGFGVVQDIAERYSGITPHIHFEARKDGKLIDPTQFV